MAYIGRFAPSPTGPLHFGSLVAAVASYCDAKSHQGKWLVRIENVDTTREVKGAKQNIIDCLEAYGFKWDGEIIMQNQRTDIYQQHLSTLIQNKFAYPCICTRKAIANNHKTMGIEGYIYPRTCYNHQPDTKETCTWRMHVGNSRLSFTDRIAGTVTHNMPTDIGDFVLKRTDGIFSYHLAVAVDDALQGVTHIVRGADLLHSTSRQIIIQQSLEFPTPQYMHIPVVKNDNGEKLSKQTQANAIQPSKASVNLYKAFCFLNLNPPVHLQQAPIPSLWEWAIACWKHTYLT